MQKKRSFLVLFVFLFAFSINVKAQNEIIHFAHFVDTETNVYKDLSNRLIMNFTISNVVDQNDLGNIEYKFNHYGAFESVQFTASGDPGVYSVYAISKPGVRVKDLRKLFVACGIFTLFVDEMPYPSEDFSVQMLNTN